MQSTLPLCPMQMYAAGQIVGLECPYEEYGERCDWTESGGRTLGWGPGGTMEQVTTGLALAVAVGTMMGETCVILLDRATA
jgi:hypothetical protein